MMLVLCLLFYRKKRRVQQDAAGAQIVIHTNETTWDNSVYNLASITDVPWDNAVLYKNRDASDVYDVAENTGIYTDIVYADVISVPWNKAMYSTGIIYDTTGVAADQTSNVTTILALDVGSDVRKKSAAMWPLLYDGDVDANACSLEEHTFASSSQHPHFGNTHDLAICSPETAYYSLGAAGQESTHECSYIMRDRSGTMFNMPMDDGCQVGGCDEDPNKVLLFKTPYYSLGTAEKFIDEEL